jgi:outer membrane protein OmpA-like peptidoglycan-associated protein
MKRICLVLCALVIGTAALGAEKNLLTPEPERITDEAIADDIKVMQALQKRLALLNNKGVPTASYHFAKAQAWLDFAMDEYTMNDRSRVVEEALGQALGLIEPLEKGVKHISLDTPIIPTSTRVRTDLWEKAEAMKKNSESFRCAGDKIAQLEVQLVWAGHEEKELGWRHSKPFLQAAERLAREADDQMESCPPPPKELTAVAVKTAPEQPSQQAIAPVVATAGAAAALPTKPRLNPASTTLTGNTDASTKLTESTATSVKCDPGIPALIAKTLAPLPDSVHFAYKSADISSISGSVIARIAATMNSEPDLRLVLYGHTDQRGGLNYNMNLSRKRAENVRTRLVSAGVATDRIVIAPIGKIRPLSRERNSKAYARNRRVEFLFTMGPPQAVIPQVEDLQQEKGTGSR